MATTLIVSVTIQVDSLRVEHHEHQGVVWGPPLIISVTIQVKALNRTDQGVA